MEHLPDGRQHPHTHSVRHVAGWLRYRLACWHIPGGGLHPTPGQLAADHARRIRAEQAHRAAERAAAQVAAGAADAAAIRGRLPVVSRVRRAARRGRSRPPRRPAKQLPSGSSVSPVRVPPGRLCGQCGAALDPDGSCFMCRGSSLKASEIERVTQDAIAGLAAAQRARGGGPRGRARRG
jgi:hypothetical protein